MNLHEVGVLALGDGRRLALEARAVDRVGLASVVWQFQCDLSVEGAMPGKIYNTHSASAQYPLDLVPRDPGRPCEFGLRFPWVATLSSELPAQANLGRNRQRAVDLKQPRQRLGKLGKVE